MPYVSFGREWSGMIHGLGHTEVNASRKSFRAWCYAEIRNASPDIGRLSPLSLCVAIAIALGGCGELGVESPQFQLISAVLADDTATVESLLNDPHVDINWRTPKTGENALYAAAGHNRVAIVQLFLRRGADPNIATNEAETPLQTAAYHGYVQVVKLLIDAGADVNTAETRYGFTALAAAARNGHSEVIQLLLDAGADRRARLKDGRTAKQVAEQYQQLNAANVLTFYRSGPAGRSD